MEKYTEILLNDKKVDWHDEQVPKGLITQNVKDWSNSVIEQIGKLESTLSELTKIKRKKRQHYIDRLWAGVKNSPYTLNNDFYMIKKGEIDENQKKKTTNRKSKTSKRRTKKV